MGINDVSFRGSDQYFTPNIDALAYNGIILKNYYVPAMCTPSRSSLMTGKYPTSVGMHHYVIDSDEPWGLPLEEKIMPQYFQDAGYSTSMFGAPICPIDGALSTFTGTGDHTSTTGNTNCTRSTAITRPALTCGRIIDRPMRHSEITRRS